jgi:capsular exopolysaccharide synthesis family protein
VPDPLPVFEQDLTARNRPDAVAAAVLSENSLAAEQFRLLGSRVRAIDRERPLRTIGVVSASPGEGKTTVSIGLARHLALGGRDRVLLVEADLRRPALDEALGLPPPTVGVRQHLEAGRGPLVIRRLSGNDGCWVLSAGEGTLRRPDVLASPRMVALLEAARASFRYVVVDCPPIAPVADAILLQDHLDGFVFVVRSRHAPREAVQRATEQLKAGAILGIVFNGHQEIIRSYYSYGYDHYTTPAKGLKGLRTRRSR